MAMFVCFSSPTAVPAGSYHGDGADEEAGDAGDVCLGVGGGAGEVRGGRGVDGAGLDVAGGGAVGVGQGGAGGGLEAGGDGDVLRGGARLGILAVGAAGALDEAEGAGRAGPRSGAARLAEARVVAETVDDVGSVAAGHVASAEGIGAGGALGGGGGRRELLSLDEDFVDEAFVDGGSETGRAEEQQREGGWQAHFGGRTERKGGAFGSLRAWRTKAADVQ